MVNADGTVAERYAYDPWGRRRNPDNWLETDKRTAFILNRGYTGHEHIDQFGIINMNGRVYDPLTAQFLSPDPYVQAPDNWLNYNRYSYCLNNPFMYTDPSGEFVFTLICTFVPGLQPLLPIAIAADAAWMSEYISQVATNYMISKDMDYTGKDIWLGKIDWFDVGYSAVAGGVSAAFPIAAPWIKYGSPFITNAVDIHGDGNVRTIFGGSTNDGSNGTKPLGRYFANSGLEVISISGTDLTNNYFGKEFNLPKNLNETPKSELWNAAGKKLWNDSKWDFMSSFSSKLAQEGLRIQYDNDLKEPQYDNSYKPNYPNPYIPNYPYPNKQQKDKKKNLFSLSLSL